MTSTPTPGTLNAAEPEHAVGSAEPVGPASRQTREHLQVVGAAAPTSTGGELVRLTALADPAEATEVDDVVTVDGIVLATPAAGAGVPRRPILPGWLKSWPAFRDAALWALRHGAHVTAFHGLRLPLYGLRLACRAPIGSGRMLAGLIRWATDAEGRQVRSDIRAGADPAVWVRLTEQHRQMVRGRLLLTGLAAVTVWCVSWAVVLAVPGPALAGAIGLVVGLLGILGRSEEHPVTSRSIDTEAVPRLTQDLIITALGSLGIGELNRSLRIDGAAALRFPAPIQRDGPGWRADIDLPAGVTAGDIIERRDRLASGLRRPIGAVWPGGDHDVHAGRLVLWVGDKPMAKARPVPWPLAKAGTVDLFRPFPIGVDPRGRPVEITLMFGQMLLGGIPRFGKSFQLRLILLAAALDPRVELHSYDLKGSPDYLPLEQIAHRFRIGDELEDITYLLADLRELSRDMARRYRTIRGLPRPLCPEGKITPELASRPDLGLAPIVLALDECQRAFEHPQHGAEIETVVTDLSKRGPAVGIIVILSTQRPDAKSLPTAISSNAILRFCLRVNGQVENDMVLGTSAYKNGVRATMFSRQDVGIGYLSGEADEPTITRGAYIDVPAAETIAARARAARVAAGLLTGHAAGLDPDPDPETNIASILDHLATIWPPTEDKVWWDDLAERLAATFPGLYGAWTGEQVTTAVRPHGLKSIQIKRTVDGRPLNRRGLHRHALANALDDRTDGDYRWPPYLPPDHDSNPDPEPDRRPVEGATSDPDPGYQ